MQRLIICTLAWVRCAHADVRPLVVLPNTSSYTMAPYLEWYKDTSGTLTIDDVASPDMAARFQAAGPKNLNFGMTSSTVWLKFSLTTKGGTDGLGRPLAEQGWVLDMGWVALGDVRLYVPEEIPGTWKIFETGVLHRAKPGEDPLINFCALVMPLPSGEKTWTYYVRVKSDAAMLLPITLYTYNAYQQHSNLLVLGYGIFYGLILSTILGNLTAYRWIQDSSLFWYSALLFFALLYFLGFNMIWERFFPISDVIVSERLAHFFMACTLIVVAPFYRSCVHVDRPSRLFDGLLIAYLALAIPGMTLTFLPFVSLQFLKSYDSFVGCGVLLIIVVSTIISWRSRYRPGQILPFAWAFFGLFALRHILTLWGFLTVSPWSYYSLQIGVAALTGVFSYAVWYRLKVIRDAREQTVRESEERYRILADNITDVIWTMDTQGRFTFISPSVERVFGYSVEQVVQRPLEDFVSAAAAEIARSAIAEELNHLPAERGGRVIELEQFRKDGSSTWVEINASVLHDAQGCPKAILGVTREIAERRRQDEERQKLQTQMQNTQKLESLGVLAGGIAHDFNNLLASILGFASLLLEELTPQSSQWDMAIQIEQAGERARELVGQMLAYSGRGTFVVKPLNLNSVIKEIGNLLKASLSKKAALHFELADTLPSFKGDATQIRQVIMNLIVNASESLGNCDGTIAVSTGVTSVTQAVLARSQWSSQIPEGDYVYLEVSDTGCGMDESTLSKIFDPFFTTKFTGRGLGLAATLGIIRSHFGAIEVRSAPNQGSTFRIIFPVFYGDAPAARTIETAKPLDWNGKGTVLVIDDEEPVRKVVAAMAKHIGLDVRQACNGQEGIDIYRAHASEIFVVLLDLSMPGLSGDLVFAELKQIRSDVQVILSSGYCKDDASKLFAGKGLACFIQKPYRLKELQETLRLVLPKAMSAEKDTVQGWGFPL